MDRIFISYRREDSAATSGRIYDRLVARFGSDGVFKDVESIPLGVNFEHYIGDVVSQCAVQLVVIGPTWLDIAETVRRFLSAHKLPTSILTEALHCQRCGKCCPANPYR